MADTSSKPMYRPVYVGIRPKLGRLNKSCAGTIFLYLLCCLDDRTGQCNPAVPTIADALRLDKKTVVAGMKLIEASGVAIRERRAGTTDNWSFPALDIRDTAAATLPEKRVHPKNGSTQNTGGGSTRKTGRGSTRKTGYEETSQEETTNKKEEACGLGGADAPHSPSADVQPEGQIQGVAKPTASQPATNRAKPGLTDQQKPLVLQSPDHRAAYLLFGATAAGRKVSECVDLAPATGNWAPTTCSYRRPEQGATLAQLAAYADFRLNAARYLIAQPMRHMQIPKLIGVIKRLLGGWTQEQVVDHVDRVGSHWAAIQSALGKWGAGLSLDETILGNSQVITQSEKLAAGQNIVPTTNPIQPSLEDKKYAHLYG